MAPNPFRRVYEYGHALSALFRTVGHAKNERTELVEIDTTSLNSIDEVVSAQHYIDSQHTEIDETLAILEQDITLVEQVPHFNWTIKPLLVTVDLEFSLLAYTAIGIALPLPPLFENGTDLFKGAMTIALGGGLVGVGGFVLYTLFEQTQCRVERARGALPHSYAHQKYNLQARLEELTRDHRDTPF